MKLSLFILWFQNFSLTKKRVLGEVVEGAEVGWYVTVFVKEVGRHLVEKMSSPVVLSSLLPHEHRMSVVNMAVRRSLLSHSRPVKSKERLVFHCGFRRFAACPVFSQHTNGDKHKYERFFMEGETVVMTTFAPITFPPAPILVFQEQSSGDHCLLATGSLLSVDPDRIVFKRTVLSGHPFKVVTLVLGLFSERPSIAFIYFRSTRESLPSGSCSLIARILNGSNLWSCEPSTEGGVISR